MSGQDYYFSSTGYVKIGWFAVEGDWYFAGSGGGLQKGWKKDGNNWYYLDPGNHVMLEDGIYDIDGVYYAFAHGGAMIKGWYEYAGEWFFFGSDGRMRYGWINTGGKWYFADKSIGYLYRNRTYTENGKNYRFTESGAMVLGFYKIGSRYQYYNSNGVQQVNAWVQYHDKKWYYIDASGYMLANTSRTINGKVYRFAADGHCTNP